MPGLPGYDVIHFNSGLHDLKHVRTENGLIDVGVGTRWVPLDAALYNDAALAVRRSRTRSIRLGIHTPSFEWSLQSA